MRRCRAVLTVWLLAVVAIVALGITVAGGFETKSDISGSAAQSALEKMDHDFGASDRQSAQILFEAPPGHVVQGPREGRRAEALSHCGGDGSGCVIGQ